MHQIAKINHCETSILGGIGIRVKLANREIRRRHGVKAMPAAFVTVGAFLNNTQVIVSPVDPC